MMVFKAEQSFEPTFPTNFGMSINGHMTRCQDDKSGIEGLHNTIQSTHPIFGN